ncbi:ATP-binding protein [Plantactinospora sp. WMMC1484]|uniref:ATP-binding protein n=1 Tax=Plantactinospora sp. WMMC1484 TaxID=3404122 RepID=UPI003BF496E4
MRFPPHSSYRPEQTDNGGAGFDGGDAGARSGSGSVDTFAILLRRYRHRARLTQEEVADRSGLSVRTVRNAERDGAARLRFNSVRRLADSLGLDADDRQRLDAAADAQLPPAPAAPVRQSGPTWSPMPAAPPGRLPAAIASFAGRADEMRELDGLLDAAGGGPMPVVAVLGSAGVGKTALAVHWGQRVAERFPGGQFYVNLRGFHPTGVRMEPGEAVRGLIEALGIPPQRMPPTLDAQLELYRRVLADRRVLLVLDNAADAEHVRPLLPGSSTVAVVVTSRNNLMSLVAVEAAHPMTLRQLNEADSHLLLYRRLGQQRVRAEPEAAAEIVRLCARLPLALSIVAARAATHRGFALADLAAELRDVRGRLDHLGGPDAIADVRAVMSWSYQSLDAEAARLFRLLGLHPGAEVGRSAAASLAGIDAARAAALLRELAVANLLDEHRPGRYTCYSLLHVFATELVDLVDSPAARRAATLRLLDHYLHTAYRAALQLDPHRETITLAPAADGTICADIVDLHTAVAWFTAEHPTILALVSVAVREGFTEHVWRLVWTMLDFWDRRAALWQAWLAVAEQALDTADRVGDDLVRAHCRRSLAQVQARLGDTTAAERNFGYAIAAYRRLELIGSLAHTHRNHAWVMARDGRHDDAIAELHRAMPLFEAGDDEAGQARTLNSIGWYHAHLGDFDRCLRYCLRAMARHRRTGDRFGEADTWDSIGYAYHHLGQQTAADSAYQRALALYRELGDRSSEADTLVRLGDLHRATGDLAAARLAWQQALTILDASDEREAGEIRRRLGEIAEPS